VASSNRTINVGPVTWTPAPAGSPVTLTGIKSANYDEKVEVTKESADFDLFNTIAAVTHYEPTMSLETINPYQLMSTAGGARGTLLVTIRDALSGVTASGGGYTLSMANAFIEQRSQSYKHRAYGTQTLNFGCYSTDGSTHPVTVTAL
jgi:hypothetical protein